jgi:Zn-finger nucleic acid-binding protein
MNLIDREAPMTSTLLKCPVCKDVFLGEQRLGVELVARNCAQCRGNWLGGQIYFKWLEAGGITFAMARPVNFTPNDTKRAKLCPDCGHFLHRSRVERDIAFTIERCTLCGGFWLDRGEWEMLVAHGLHDDLHRIFSPGWQVKLMHERIEMAEAHVLESKLGKDDLEEARRVKQWMESHPHRAELYAFLAR